jgi:hypothetical protein
VARTRWQSDLGTPASCTGQADQAGSAGRCQELGPGRQIDLRTARAAPADSEVRPGPRPQTLRPYQAETSEAGPEAQSTSSLPIRRGVALTCGAPCRDRRTFSSGSCWLGAEGEAGPMVSLPGLALVPGLPLVGLRRCEVLGLRIEHVQVVGGWLVVVGSRVWLARTSGLTRGE